MRELMESRGEALAGQRQPVGCACRQLDTSSGGVLYPRRDGRDFNKRLGAAAWQGARTDSLT